MKTTIELPDAIFERTKIAVAQRRTTLKNLVIEGLERVLADPPPQQIPLDAIARLRSGYKLGGNPLTREATHES
jgi:hypothetical protein